MTLLQYRTREDKARDQKWEDHLDYLCGDDCEWCLQAESEAAIEKEQD